MAIESEIKANLESVLFCGGYSEDRQVPSGGPISDRLMIGYMIRSMSEKQVNRFIEMGAGLFQLVAADYHLRFSGKAGDNDKFLGSDENKAIDLFADLLENKDPKKYGSNGQEQSMISDEESSMAASAYLSLLHDPRAVSLIDKARSINDLKAILMIEKTIPLIRYADLEALIAEQCNPEQTFIKLAKIRAFERKLEGVEDLTGRLRQTRYAIEKLASKRPGRSSSKSMIGLMKTADEICSQYREYREDYRYGPFLKPFFDEYDMIREAVTGFVQKQTAKALASIDPEFELGENLDDDLKKVRSLEEKVEQVAIQYEIFNADRKVLDDAKERIQKRKTYISMSKDVNEKKSQVRNIDPDLPDVSRAKELMTIRSDLEKMLEGCSSMGENDAVLFRERVYAAFTLQKTMIERMKKATENMMRSIDPQVQSTGLIDKDISQIKAQEKKYNVCLGVYACFGVSRDEMGGLARSLEEARLSYQLARTKREGVKKNNQNLDGLRKYVLAHISSGNAKKQQARIRDSLVQLKTYEGVYQEMQQDHDYTRYAEIKGLVMEGISLLSSCYLQIREQVGKRVASISSSIVAIEKGLAEYERKNFFLRMLSRKRMIVDKQAIEDFRQELHGLRYIRDYDGKR